MRRFPSSRLVGRITKRNKRARVDRCGVMRRSLVEDENTGSPVDADRENPWPLIDTGVPVRIETMTISAREMAQGVAVESVAVFRARFEPGYDIRNTDRIIGETPDILGRVFEMTGPDSVSNRTATIMICREVT